MGLIIVLVFLIVAGLTTLLASSPRPDAGDWNTASDEAMAEARAALIGRAASDDNRPGSLPCPDMNNDGIAELLVGHACPSYLGRLPWRTLGLPDLRDASGERLWYALSPSFLDDDPVYVGPLNSDTPAQISVTGLAPATSVAAVIIAPGAALPGQSRDAVGQNNVINYLEGENANGDNVYQTAIASSTFNDRVSIITHDQLFNVVEWRVANEIRARLERYFQQYGYFPFANDYATFGFGCTNNSTRGRIPNPDGSQISATCSSNGDWLNALSIPPPLWFYNNSWHLLTYYSLAPACTSAMPNCTGPGGFLTINNSWTDIRAVVIVGSRALGTQTRPCTTADKCIEQPDPSNNKYQRQSVSATYNDKVAVIR